MAVYKPQHQIIDIVSTWRIAKKPSDRNTPESIHLEPLSGGFYGNLVAAAPG